jgi:carbon-monoxide dehydrogenase medium subunit
VKPARFDYVRPRDLDEAGVVLAGADGDAKLLAGGQSLGPMLNLRLARPSLLIDISRLDSLRRVEETRDAWRIGAGVTHAALEDAAGRMAGGEMLCEVAAGIAYRSVRNRGTIGGSLAHADPAADWPLALAVMGASVVVRGPRGATRRIAAESFMVSTVATRLEPAEIIECVDVPKSSATARYGYFKFCRKAGEFPEASAAAVIDRGARTAIVYVGALDGPPLPLAGFADAIAEKGEAAVTREAALRAVEMAAPGLDPVDRAIHAATALRAVRQALAP